MFNKITDGSAFAALGQVRYYQQAGNTFIQLNTTGTNAADSVIRLTGLISLDAVDFIA